MRSPDALQTLLAYTGMSLTASFVHRKVTNTADARGPTRAIVAGVLIVLGWLGWLFGGIRVWQARIPFWYLFSGFGVVAITGTVEHLNDLAVQRGMSVPQLVHETFRAAYDAPSEPVQDHSHVQTPRLGIYEALSYIEWLAQLLKRIR